MNPIMHPTNNRQLPAPIGWDQSDVPCETIAVTEARVEGVAVIASWWMPTPGELATLNAGGAVCLICAGQTMPPVQVLADEMTKAGDVRKTG